MESVLNHVATPQNYVHVYMWIPQTVYCYFWEYLFSTFRLFLHFLVVVSVW